MKSPVVFCFAVRAMKVFQIITLLMQLLRMPLPGSWKPRTGSPVLGFQLLGKDTFLELPQTLFIHLILHYPIFEIASSN